MVRREVRAKIGKGCVERCDGDGWDDEIAAPGELGQRCGAEFARNRGDGIKSVDGEVGVEEEFGEGAAEVTVPEQADGSGRGWHRSDHG